MDREVDDRILDRMEGAETRQAETGLSGGATLGGTAASGATGGAAGAPGPGSNAVAGDRAGVERSMISSEKGEGDPCTVFLGGLSFDSDEGAIKKVFEEFGDVVATKMVYDRITGMPRGFGFVTFADPKSAALAIEEMNGQVVDGREIRVSRVQRNPPYRRSFDDPQRWDRGRQAERDAPGPPEKEYRDHGDQRGGAGPAARPGARNFRGPSPGRFSPPPGKQGRYRSRSPDADRRYGEDRGKPRRGPPPQGIPDDETGFDDGDAFYERERDEWQHAGRADPPLQPRSRLPPQGRDPPGRMTEPAVPSGASGRASGPASDRMPSVDRSASGLAASPAGSGRAPSSQPAGSSGKSPSGLKELKESVQAARTQRDALTTRIASLEEALHNSNSSESFLKERIKSLEQAKKQAAAQLEHRSSIYHKIILTLAKVQEAQDRAKEAEKELKSIMRPLLPTLKEELANVGDPKDAPQGGREPTPGVIDDVPAILGASAVGLGGKDGDGPAHKLNVSAAA